MLALLIAGIALAQTPPATTQPGGLIAYVNQSNDTYDARIVEPYYGCTQIQMTSHTWRGIPWKHRIVVVQPEKPLEPASDLGYLHITGGDPNAADLALARRIANLSGLPVHILFDIPNQPLFDGLKEDELIAYTFLQYIEGGEADWPLLYPMVKSTVRAMDAVVAHTKTRRFILNGASKRGWTTWLAGAIGDQRVVGLAPMVYDNLNLVAQMLRQAETFAGGHSEQISDYARAGLLEKIASPKGQELIAHVDPFAYRRALELPKLILTGSNDPYWPVDAMTIYWDALGGRKSARVVPNAGHDLGSQAQWVPTLAAFGYALATDGGFPTVRWTWADRNLTMDGLRQHVESARMWVAESDTLDFRGSTWREIGAQKGMRRTTISLPAGRKNQAAFGELAFKVGGIEFSLTTAPRVFPAAR